MVSFHKATACPPCQILSQAPGIFTFDLLLLFPLELFTPTSTSSNLQVLLSGSRRVVLGTWIPSRVNLSQLCNLGLISYSDLQFSHPNECSIDDPTVKLLLFDVLLPPPIFFPCSQDSS